MEPIANRTGIIIVQHPRERLHPFGTVRLVVLALQNVRCTVHWSPHAGPAELEVPPESALLYPGATAKPLDELAPAERPRHLVVLDGTWWQSRQLLRASPFLQQLPRVTLRRAAPGQYRIRREPRPECLSTIEAIHRALAVLEPDNPDLDRLLAFFTGFIDEQLEARGRRVVPRHRVRPRPPLSHALPVGLRNRDRLVVGHAEWLGEKEASGARHSSLLAVAAVRLGDGATFQCVIRPEEPVSPERLAHLGMTAELLDEGHERSEFRGLWNTFLRSSDVVAAWHPRTLAELAPDGDGLLLKAAYCNSRRGRCGDLGDVLAREGLQPTPTPFSGRLGLRLGQMLAVAQRLSEEASSLKNEATPDSGCRESL